MISYNIFFDVRQDVTNNSINYMCISMSDYIRSIVWSNIRNNVYDNVMSNIRDSVKSNVWDRRVTDEELDNVYDKVAI